MANLLTPMSLKAQRNFNRFAKQDTARALKNKTPAQLASDQAAFAQRLAQHRAAQPAATGGLK